MLDTSETCPDMEMSKEEMLRELQIQRIELELQQEEIRQCHEELEATQERFSDLYLNAPVGYVTLDKNAEIGEANYRAAELLGSNRKSLVGNSLFDCVSPRCRSQLEEHLEQLFDSGTGVYHTELLVDLPTDSTSCLKMLSIVIDDSTSGELQCRAALFDFTTEQQARREKSKLEEQLHKSHRMETLGRLSSGIAHDFNNLLTLIIGYSKLAINYLPEGDPLEKHVLEINKAGHHASELIEQLLAFSRSDDKSSAPVNVNERISEMETMFDRLIGDDIELHLRLNERLGEIHFDSAQLQQVLLNLVVNARDAMAQGGNLYLRTRNITVDEKEANDLELKAGAHILIEVEDEGDGIPPEVIPHIFKPFFTTKSTPKNHGFGLSTTYGIVSRHNGTIDVVSEPEVGTRFRVLIPRANGESAVSADEEATPAVLVVDDQPDLREFASLVLEEMDVEVISAHSPEDALQLSRTYGDELTLIVTDVTMPGMSGPQLLNRIREFHPRARVLFISGHDRDSLCMERDLAPEAPFLEKPFSPDHLREMVEALLTDEL